MLWSVWHQYHINVAIIHHQIAFTAAIYVINPQGQEIALMIATPTVPVATQAYHLHRVLQGLILPHDRPDPKYPHSQHS